MKKESTTLFAIFKEGKHIGNERGRSKLDAIKKYVKSAGYDYLINDLDFINSYSSEKAINGIHHHFIPKKQLKKRLQEKDSSNTEKK